MTLMQHLKMLDDRGPEMLTQIQELANLNSGTLNLAGLVQVKQKLVSLFSELGGDLKLVDSLPRQTIDDAGNQVTTQLGQSIHIRKRPDADRQVLLCIHMDTVYPPSDPFQSCRLLPDGRLNGPGVADAKGGLIVMLKALEALEASPLAEHVGWEVLINPDEEIGSPGSINLIEEIAQRCDFGLLFEPALSGNALVSWRKGSGNFTFVVRGRSAHAGRDFAFGRNAITAAARLVTAIDEFNTDPETTFNVGRVLGGGALNVVPDLALVQVNVRVRTPAEQAQVEQQFQALTEEFNRLDGITVERHGGFSSPPKPITPGMEGVQRRVEASARELGLEIQWQGTGGASDGNKFAAAGLPNVDSLGPCGGCIHSHDEFLLPDSLVPRAKLAALILLQYAQQPPERG